jgi:hypothetical protein
MGAIYAPRTTTKGRTSAIRARGRSHKLIKNCPYTEQSAQVHDLVRVREGRANAPRISVKGER